MSHLDICRYIERIFSLWHTTHSHKMPFFGLYSHCFISDNPLYAADINELWRCRLVWSLILFKVKKNNKEKCDERTTTKREHKKKKYDFLNKDTKLSNLHIPYFSVELFYHCIIIRLVEEMARILWTQMLQKSYGMQNCCQRWDENGRKTMKLTFCSEAKSEKLNDAKRMEYIT